MASSTNPGYASTPKDVPGEPVKMSTATLDTGATIVQRMDPINQICQHLTAFHYYAHDMTRQVEAHHYCSHLTEDVMQCLIYDTDEPSARLIGVEFIISEKIFQSLPEDEKKLWHSHEYEVKSGLLFMPRLPQAAERVVMQKLGKTFGKTWHFWQFDRGDVLPLGVPQLMGAFKRDGQVAPGLVEDVENRYKVSLDDKREHRKDLEGPEGGTEEADFWDRTGKGLQLELKEVELKKERGLRQVDVKESPPVASPY